MHSELPVVYEVPEIELPPEDGVYATPQKVKTRNEKRWKRNNWTCNLACELCGDAAQPVKKDIPLIDISRKSLCLPSCKHRCDKVFSMAARKKVRFLRHEAYIKGSAHDSV